MFVTEEKINSKLIMNTDREKEKFMEKLNESLDKDTFVKITFGKYKGGDKDFKNIFVNRIDTKEGVRLSFKFRYATKDIVKNYEYGAGIRLVSEILGKDFFSGTLFTSEHDYTLDYSKKRIPILHTKNPSFAETEAQSHNKVKHRYVNADAKYLQLLGITTSEGKVKADKYDKFRQVDKFLETMDSLFRSSGLNVKDQIRIMDMGSGKSYLSFAVYEYFTDTLNKKITMQGIEQRDDLVKLSNYTAGECGFRGLSFKKGTIENSADEISDIVIALHACDTATDDAIVKALKAEAEMIILAPCCQKYLRKQFVSPAALKGIFKHGINEERMCVMLTDGLRALMLEYYGYDTKVFEFISTEHTARNTMISAVKKRPLDKEKLIEIEAVKKEFTINDFYLDKILM